jgi:YegS/Rv2252/BmrU family lipid kinase
LKKYLFIVNPIAGGGRGEAYLPHLKNKLHNCALSNDIIITEYKEHAKDIAFQNQEHYNAIISVGGDGTLNEVINGIGLNHNGVAVGLVPLGSGNDFAKTLKYSGSANDVLDFLIDDGSSIEIDLGEAYYKEAGTDVLQSRFFINGLGVGFDALVASLLKRHKYLTGLPAYMLAVVKSLWHYKNVEIKVTLNGGEKNLFETQRQFFLIAVGNGKYSGGGFMLNPAANPHDGFLDGCFVEGLTVPQIPIKIPKAINGTHASLKEASLLRFSDIKLELQTPYFVHIDGDVVSEKVTELSVRLNNKKINFLHSGK